jgi:hypothetical protein
MTRILKGNIMDHIVNKNMAEIAALETYRDALKADGMSDYNEAYIDHFNHLLVVISMKKRELGVYLYDFVETEYKK